MYYFPKKLSLYFLLLTSIITLSKEATFSLKNNTDRPIQAQLQITSPIPDYINPRIIEAGNSWISDAKLTAKNIWGLTIKYCSTNNCPDPSAFDKKYSIRFGTPRTQKYHVTFSLDNNNVPTLVPQPNIQNNVHIEQIINNNAESIVTTVKTPTPEKTQLSILTGKSASMTQSEAHMSLNVIREEVEKVYKLSTNPYYKELYNAAVDRERQHRDCYVFYNAFSNEWRVPQDLYLKLYKRLHVLTFNIENFRAFRWIPVSHITPKEFLKNELKTHGMVNDNEWRVKSYLLSTNLAFFGNVGFPGECTFEYFLNAISQTKINAAIFKSILDIFDDPAKYTTGTEPMLYKYIPRISELDDLLIVDPLPNHKKPGTLTQIFIPKDIIDNVAYVSWVAGIPHEEKMINWVLTEAQQHLGVMPLYQKTGLVLGDIKELFKDEQEKHPLFQLILDGIEKGKYQMSTILEEYITYPELVPGLNNLQARLVLSSDYLGNPNSGIKMYEYDRIKPDAKQKYEDAINKIVLEIVEDLNAAALKLNRALGL